MQYSPVTISCHLFLGYYCFAICIFVVETMLINILKVIKVLRISTYKNILVTFVYFTLCCVMFNHTKPSPVSRSFYQQSIISASNVNSNILDIIFMPLDPIENGVYILVEVFFFYISTTLVSFTAGGLVSPRGHMWPSFTVDFG